MFKQQATIGAILALHTQAMHRKTSVNQVYADLTALTQTNSEAFSHVEDTSNLFEYGSEDHTKFVQLENKTDLINELLNENQGNAAQMDQQVQYASIFEQAQTEYNQQEKYEFAQVAVKDNDASNSTVEQNNTELAETAAETMTENRSTQMSDPVRLTLVNETDETVQTYWYNQQGRALGSVHIGPQGVSIHDLAATHFISVRALKSSFSSFTIDGDVVHVIEASENNTTLQIAKRYRFTQQYKSTEWSEQVSLSFINETDETVTILWHDYSGNPKTYFTLQPNQTRQQWTMATHPWSAISDSGVYLNTGGKEAFVPAPKDHERTIQIREKVNYCQDINRDPNVPATDAYGTIFMDSDWLPEDAQSTLRTIDAQGSCIQNGYDRRDQKFSERNFWCFQAQFEEGEDPVTIRVNRDDFGYDLAATHANTYGTAVGRIPFILRLNVKSITIHDGMSLFGGGGGDLLIYTGYDETHYQPGKMLEEVLIHEAAHASHQGLMVTEEWKEAVKKDNKFVSGYAMEHPLREDISETFVLWFGTRYAPDEFTEEELAIWECQIGNRLKVLDEMSCKPGMMSPWLDC